MRAFTWLTPRPVGWGNLLWNTYILFYHKRTGGPLWMRDQLSSGATSGTPQTWKTIHTIHAPIHSNKTNMKEWLRLPNDIRGPCGPKASWHLSNGWGNTPLNLTQQTCPDRGSNSGLPAWQTRMLPPVPQWWNIIIVFVLFVLYLY